MSLNLKTRLGIWYLIVMLFLSFAFFIGMYFALSKILVNREYLRIKEQSNEATHYVAVENGNIKIVGNYLQNFIDHGGFAAIYNTQGEVLAGKMPGDAIFPKSANTNDVITIISSDEQTKYIVFDIQLNDQGTAFGWLRLSKIQYSEKALRNTLNSFLVAVPIYVGLAVLGGLLLINKALSPISSIISKAKSISSGNLSVRIGSTNSKDEVGQLAISIDQMMDSIESAYNRQRQFAQDASHELRTPITVITTTAEDAFSSATSLEECKDALQTILVKGKEMSSLISQLLMITKGFSENYEPEVEILDLSLSVQVIVDELSLVASDTGIVIHTCISPGLLIKANQTLLTRLVINLVENAIKYNKHGGNVWVDVYSDKKKNYLVVRDNGIGIGENDIPYIWDRFFKGDRSRADSGTGLGLAMVKWIADLYGATIQVESKIGIGSSFKVGFHSEFQT